jgi:isoamylase
VSYQHKHNEGNGEGNRDGGNQHYSANHGVEGPSDDPAILALRVRQSKNLLATLLLARGVPMILGGDEFARSQNGNNNAYCQDNATSWFDWVLVRREAKMLRFVRGVIALRRRQPALREDRFYNPDEIAWFGAGDLAPDWHGPSSALGCVIRGPHGDAALCLLFNAGTEDAAFTLPPAPPDTEWRVAIDTSAESPDDFAEPGRDRPLSAAPVYRQPAHCLVLLLAEQSPKSLKD